MAPEVNPPYGITCSAVPQHIPQGSIERPASAAPHLVQHKVEWRGSRTRRPPLPVFQILPPVTPHFRCATGNFEPVVANEKEVVRAPP